MHLLNWPAVEENWVSKGLEEDLRLLLDLRALVLKALDEKRKAGDIGSALEAGVTIKTSDVKKIVYLNSKRSLLESVFIVSSVEIKEEGSPDWTIEVKKAIGDKCGRCWNYRVDVGKDVAHPTICGRCVAQVNIINSGSTECQ